MEIIVLFNLIVLRPGKHLRSRVLLIKSWKRFNIWCAIWEGVFVCRGGYLWIFWLFHKIITSQTVSADIKIVYTLEPDKYRSLIVRITSSSDKILVSLNVWYECWVLADRAGEFRPGPGPALVSQKYFCVSDWKLLKKKYLRS